MFPLAAFFITYFLTKGEDNNMKPAIIVIMIATAIQMIVHYIKHKKIEKIHIITLLSVVVLGGITILIDNPIFFKMKVTAIYLVMAIVFYCSHYIGEKPITKRLLEKAVNAPDSTWKKITASWSLFFSALAIANIIVAFYCSQDTWVYFKTFGTMGLMLVFMVIQMYFIRQYIIADNAETKDSQQNGE